MAELLHDTSAFTGGDQAAGLRRLLGRSTARVITLEAGAGGSGKTSVAINLAAALATRGLQVLLLDANAGASNVSAALGLRSRLDLRDALSGRSDIEDTLLHGPAGVKVLPAGVALRSGHGARERARFDAAMAQLAPRFDYVLIDASAEDGAGSLLQGFSAESIVVSAAGASSITATYALIKRLHAQQPQQRMHLLLNRIGNERDARVIFENLKRVAGAHLRATLECLGCVPRDAQLQRAAADRRPVVEQYPSSQAAAGFHRIAASIAAWSHPAPVRAKAQPAAARHEFQFPSYALAHAGA